MRRSLIQSFLHLTQVDPGFNPHHVLTFRLDRPQQESPSTALFRNVVSKISSLPGVDSVSAVASLPLTGDNFRCSIEIEGLPTPIGSRPAADFNAVEPNYFRTLGIALVAGRDFRERDDAKSIPVVIINRTLARRFFPNQDPIGKHVRPGIGVGTADPPMREIVGVIADVKQGSLGSESAPEVYAPLAQTPFADTVLIAMRTALDLRSMVAAVRHEVASVSKEPIYAVKTLDDYFVQSVAMPRFLALLISSFAGLAVLLAFVGVYGVVSYLVVRRTHEIGVRMALGAKPTDVLKLVIGQGVRPALAGLVIGLGTALALGHFLTILLYGIKPTDPLTFLAISVGLIGVALIASHVPVRRALRVDPILTLRYE